VAVSAVAGVARRATVGDGAARWKRELGGETVREAAGTTAGACRSHHPGGPPVVENRRSLSGPR